MRREKLGLTTPKRNAGVAYLVLDCSGSMAGDKLEEARAGALEFAEAAFTRGYTIGIISFSSDAKRVASLSSNRRDLLSALKSIEAGGSTNMAAGLGMAHTDMVGMPQVRVIAVVTDGQPDNRDASIEVARHAIRDGVEIIAIGTSDADQQFLSLITSRPDFARVCDPKELRRAISNLAGLLPPPSQPGG